MTQFEILQILEEARDLGEEWVTPGEIRRRLGCNPRNFHHKLSKLLVYSHVERRRSESDKRSWEYRAKTNI